MQQQIKSQAKKIEFKFNVNLRRALIWILILFLFLPGLIKFILGSTGVVKELPLSTAIAEIKSGKVEEVQIRGQELILLYPKDSSGNQILGMSRKEEGASFMDQLQKAGVDESKVKVEVVSQDFVNGLWNVMSLVLPIIGFGVLMFYLMILVGIIPL